MQTYNLVLSGGGARGFAHLGVIKALQEKGISFDAISATSSGAMVGALLCDGYSVEEIKEICRESLPFTSFNFSFKQGLLTIERLNTALEKHLRHKTFEELKYPLFVTATDLNTGRPVVFSSGEVIPAVIASSSIPVVLPVTYIQNTPYVDGGMSSNLPVEPFEHSSSKTIGIYVNPVGSYNPSLSAWRQFERVIHLGIRENIMQQIRKLALFIEPENLEQYGLFDTEKMEEIVRAGYDYASGLDLEALSGPDKAHRLS